MASTLVTLTVAEAALRVRRGELFTASDQGRVDGSRRTHESPFEHDELLGHVPRCGSFVDSDGARITVDEHGLRIARAAYELDGARILAVGDSFTFGDEVDDAGTWPAQLETRTGRPVLNAGVPAYGLDQAVLRAEELVGRLAPAVVVLAFVSGDVDRCELSAYSGSQRPFFAIEDGGLALQNVPVPHGEPRVSHLRHVLGTSFLAHALLRRAAPRWWYTDLRAIEHGDGEAVAQLLLARLQRFTESRGVRLLVVALCDGDLDTRHVPALARTAEVLGIAWLDLTQAIAARARAEPVHLVFRPRGHLAPATNAAVAAAIGAELDARGW